MKYNTCITCEVRNDRILTNDELEIETGQSVLKENLSVFGQKNILNNIKGCSEFYEKINKNKSDSMCSYRKKLKYEYNNEKGLKRLDSHSEKKLFDEMDNIDKISQHMNSKNGNLKKTIWKGYGLSFIVFLLVILFGVAIPMVTVFAEKGSKNRAVPSGNFIEACDICGGMDNIFHSSYIIMYIPLIMAFFSSILYINY
ncbi:CYIR protein [Plasmodium cynomolgi strain B]|uniref:CYIR protein n=1 Tax=Plasmodium cynomolgi (strain B) TaxID=1120755 RepID=K6UF82_PLACD|nr:CYIR protein [Plasmodium cynomolgi strain B]GAB69646.1 CYIR protein [Plasmodium cynomolgi strain B]